MPLGATPAPDIGARSSAWTCSAVTIDCKNFEDVTVPSRHVYMVGIVEVLRTAGGALSSAEVFEHLLIAHWARPDDVLAMQKSGESRFRKEVRFARLELERAGLLKNGAPGFWRLSELGWTTFMSIDRARDLVNYRRHGAQGRSTVSLAPGPTLGPRPTSFVVTTSRNSDKPSWVYIFRFADTAVWKVGHAVDLQARLADVNRHIPVELDGRSWVLFAWARLETAEIAYDREQAILSEMSLYRTRGERVRCTRDQVTAVWRRYVENHAYQPVATQLELSSERP